MPFEHGAAGHRAAVDRQRMMGEEVDIGLGEANGGTRAVLVADAAHDEGHVGIAQDRRGVDEGIEHRLQVEGRAADHLEHVADRRLLLQGFAQFFRAGLHLVEQADVLDGDHRLVGEGRDQLDLPFRVWLDDLAAEEQHADRLAAAHHRNAEQGTVAGDLLHVGIAIFRVGQCVCNLDGPPRQQRAADDALSSGLQAVNIDHPDPVDREVVVGRVIVAAVVLECDRAHVGIAELRGGFRKRVQNRLEVEGRTADQLEHVGGCGLLLQRLAQLLGAGLHLVEQSRVFDRDHRLVGEGLQQFDVVWSERAGLFARHADNPDRRSGVHQGHEQHAAETAPLRDLLDSGMRDRFGVGDRDRLAVLCQLERLELVDRLRERHFQQLIGGRIGRRERCEIGGLVVEAEYRGREATQQTIGAAGDCFEYRRCV
ncbi:hypothetical protein ES707_02475 [subsurface metagenome]